MKNIIIVLGLFVVVACNNKPSSDTTTATDTTGLANNPATKDPNSNVADTMKMKDSIRVKDTGTVHRKSKN